MYISIDIHFCFWNMTWYIGFEVECQLNFVTYTLEGLVILHEVMIQMINFGFEPHIPFNSKKSSKQPPWDLTKQSLEEIQWQYPRWVTSQAIIKLLWVTTRAFNTPNWVKRIRVSNRVIVHTWELWDSFPINATPYRANWLESCDDVLCKFVLGKVRDVTIGSITCTYKS